MPMVVNMLVPLVPTETLSGIAGAANTAYFALDGSGFPSGVTWSAANLDPSLTLSLVGIYTNRLRFKLVSAGRVVVPALPLGSTAQPLSAFSITLTDPATGDTTPTIPISVDLA